MESDADGSVIGGLNNAYSRLIDCIGRILVGRGPVIPVPFFVGMMTLSLCTAIAAFVSPFIFSVSEKTLFYVSYPLSVAWVAIMIFTIVRLRMRGLWGLIGLPFAAFWLGVETLLYLGCKWGYDCL